MEFIDQTLRMFLTAAASPRPVPGGGAVSALSAALAATMAEKAANFTLGKRKFASVQAEVQDLRDQLSGLRSRLVKLMDADAEAFLKLQGAQALPKTNPQEIAARQAQVDLASAEAAEVPSVVADICLDLLVRTRRLAEICNPRLLADVGVCAHVARGAMLGAHLNVLVNLRGSMEMDRLDAATARIAERLAACDEAVAAIDRLIDARSPTTPSSGESGMFELPPL
jgi:formiminotetrahydrofolate cyclodeaminase